MGSGWIQDIFQWSSPWDWLAGGVGEESRTTPCDAGIQEHGCVIYTEMGPQGGRLGRENEDYFDDLNFMDEKNEIEIG